MRNLLQFQHNTTKRHARMLLSDIHCFLEDGFPSKTYGNDGILLFKLISKPNAIEKILFSRNLLPNLNSC